MTPKALAKIVATVAPNRRKAYAPASAPSPKPVERSVARFKPEPWGQHQSSGDRVLSVNVDKVVQALKAGEGARMARIYRERDAHAAAQAAKSRIAAEQRTSAARVQRPHAPVHPVEPEKPKPLFDQTTSMKDRLKALGPHSKELKALAAADNDFEAKHPRRPGGQGETSGEFIHAGGAGAADAHVVPVKKGWSKTLHAGLPILGARNPSPEQALLGKAPRSVRKADVQRVNKGWRDPATGAMIPKMHGANMKKQTVNASTKVARATVTTSDKIFKRKKK